MREVSLAVTSGGIKRKRLDSLCEGGGRDVLDLDWDVSDAGVDECQTQICAFHYM